MTAMTLAATSAMALGSTVQTVTLSVTSGTLTVTTGGSGAGVAGKTRPVLRHSAELIQAANFRSAVAF